MTAPDWFTAILWTDPVKIEELRYDRKRLPMTSGVYVFTNYSFALEQNTGVLYVGKAKSLHKRVQSYLADPEKLLVLSSRSGVLRPSTSFNHPGKFLLLMDIQQRFRALGHGESGIWVRWHPCVAPSILENQLIKYLKPAFNTQGRTDE